MVGQRNLKPIGAAKFASSGFLLSASLENASGVGAWSHNGRHIRGLIRHRFRRS